LSFKNKQEEEAKCVGFDFQAHACQSLFSQANRTGLFFFSTPNLSLFKYPLTFFLKIEKKISLNKFIKMIVKELFNYTIVFRRFEHFIVILKTTL
jgi:hypothetical protein